MIEKLSKKKNVLNKSNRPSRNLIESRSYLNVLKKENNAIESEHVLDIQSTPKPSLTDTFFAQKSESKNDFATLWQKYVQLLAVSSQLLFEDTEKSKDKFCQILHAQIDVSNKLLLMIGPSDEKLFSEYLICMTRFLNNKNTLLINNQEPLTGSNGSRKITLDNNNGFIKKTESAGSQKLDLPESSNFNTENSNIIKLTKDPIVPPSCYTKIKNYLFEDHTDINSDNKSGCMMNSDRKKE